MSGIFGIFHLDGQSAQPQMLQKMSDILAHRGQDNSGIWTDGPVGLGSRLLWTTPESLQEKLPVGHQSDTFVLTADARIDNRDELICTFGLGDRPPQEIADSDLILYAYEKWGEDCPKYLLGAFAFVIWDRYKHKLFCVRDIFGIRPFYYYHSNDLFVFGSEVKALLCQPQVPKQLNELMVGLHLIPAMEDNALTFYKDIFRMPPRSSMTVTLDGLKIQTYWSPNDAKELHFKSNDEYAEAFREIFTEAVRCRIRSVFPVGAELSGGLDSSSVVVVAERLMKQNGNGQLHTFSSVHNAVPESDEQEYISHVVNQCDIKPHYIDMDKISPLVDMEQVFFQADETFTAPTIHDAWAICRKANEQGVRILLSGLDGDTTVSHGFETLIDMAHAARWEDFAREAKAVGKHPNLLDETSLLESFGLPYLSHLARSGRWLQFMKGADIVAAQYSISRRYIYRQYGLKPAFLERGQVVYRWLTGESTILFDDPLLKKEFAQQIKLDQQLEKMMDEVAPTTSQEVHSMSLTSFSLPFMYEWANRTATAFGIEDRHPFADRRLVEFCVSLPSEQKLQNGWTRFILRRGMEGFLPQEIQWRGGKTLNSDAFKRGFHMHVGKQLEQVVYEEPECLEPYINLPFLHDIYGRYLENKADDEEILRLWHVITLANWLSYSDLKPSAA